MKYWLLLFVLLTGEGLYAQAPGKARLFTKTEFNEDGTVGRKQLETIVVDGKMDVKFWQKHFNLFSRLPAKLIDKRYKSQTVEVWNDSTRPKDFKENWRYTYVYDSMSRVVKYNYSSCFICGSMAYSVVIEYDAQSRPVIVEAGDVLLSKTKERVYYWQLNYDDAGNITKAIHFAGGQLDRQIEVE